MPEAVAAAAAAAPPPAVVDVASLLQRVLLLLPLCFLRAFKVLVVVFRCLGWSATAVEAAVPTA